MGNYIPDFVEKRFLDAGFSGKIIYTVADDYSGKLDEKEYLLKRDDIDDVAFWKKIFSEFNSEAIVKINADAPFIDTQPVFEMMRLHEDSLAEFTFSENLPAGFTSEIVSGSLVNEIPDMDEKTLPLGKVVKSNINQFDVELYYIDPDIRDKRISFLNSDRRDSKIMENLYSLNSGFPSYKEVRNLVESHPESLFISPSYIELEITGRCELDCLFCYRKSLQKEHPDMSSEIHGKILEGLSEFGLPCTICYGGSGEPMMHNGFYDFLERASSVEAVSQVFVETNGLMADANFRSFVEGNEKIKTIININGYDRDTYRALHSTDCFDRVYKNIESLKELNEKDNRVFIQVMKINETESFLDRYYDFWEKTGLPIILQKQNTFLGRIEDRRYSDLSPVDRIPCWHLQRDLYILSDGTVAFCRQDVDGLESKGSLTEKTLSELWDIKREDFIENYRKKYSSFPACADCDEWYTFNF